MPSKVVRDLARVPSYLRKPCGARQKMPGTEPLAQRVSESSTG